MCSLQDYLKKRNISKEQMEKARKELNDYLKENQKSSKKVLDK